MNSMQTRCAFCTKPSTSTCGACHKASYCSSNHQRQHWKIHKKECTAFTIVDDPVMGKHWVASRNIKSGQLLLEEEPCVISFDWDLPEGFAGTSVHKCLTCATPKATLNRCSHCGWPVCDLQCEMDLTHAMSECQLFQKHEIPYPPPSEFEISFLDILFLIRVTMLKVQKPKVYQEVLQLFDDPEGRCGPTARLSTDIRAVILYLQKFLKEWSFVELSKLYRIGKINMFTGHILSNETTLECLYLTTSRLNHSCIPNCFNQSVQDRPGVLTRIRASVAVKKGDPLFLNYVEQHRTFQGTRQRQEFLQESFGFTCNCTRCLDPTELDTYLSAVVCPVCRAAGENAAAAAAVVGPHYDVRGYLLPTEPLSLDERAIWECNTCGENMPWKGVVQVLQPLEILMSDLAMDLVELLDFYDRAALAVSQKLVHPNHFMIHPVSRKVHEFIKKQIYTEPDAPGYKEFPVSTAAACAIHVRYLLNIEDHLNPGINPRRAELLRDLASVMEIDLYGLDTYRTPGQFLKVLDRDKEDVKTQLRMIETLREEADRYYVNDTAEFLTKNHYYLSTSLLTTRLELINLDPKPTNEGSSKKDDADTAT